MPRNTGRASQSGPLEKKIMDLLWRRQDATVRWVTHRLQQREPVAYTTAMTIMGRLVEKGLLTREAAGRAFVYRPAKTRDEFLAERSRRKVRALVEDFGDLALAHFAEEIAAVDPDRIERLSKFIDRGEET